MQIWLGSIALKLNTEDSSSPKEITGGPTCIVYNEVQTFASGTKFWYINEDLHREQGPAIENLNSTQWQYRNGKLHRDNGPAVIWFNNRARWHYCGVDVTDEVLEQGID